MLLKVSLASNLGEGPFHVMFARNQPCGVKNELNMCEFQCQDATKITSASADSRINFSWMLSLCLFLMTIFLGVSPFSPSFGTMSSSLPSGVRRVNRWTRRLVERRRENYYYDALAFSRHNIDVVSDEESMKPEKLRRAPEYAGISPSTMRVSKWNQESTREDDDPHSPSLTRTCDTFTGVDWASYQVREPVENYEERLTLKRGDMLPPGELKNPRIREEQALQVIHSNSDKVHRPTLDDQYTQEWFDYSRSVLPQSVRKQVQTLSSSSRRRISVASSSTIRVPLTGRVNSGNQENLNKPISKKETYNIADVSLLQQFGGNNHAHVILTSEADSLQTDAKTNA